jgi:DNA-binding transcriptional MerR regulator
MVRKRDRYTRLRAERSRPRAPAPKSGWLIADLARITELPLRTLQYYVHLKLIEPIELRGTSTRYQRRELLHLLGIVRTKAEGGISLADAKRKLEALGDSELEAWLATRPLPPLAAEALGLTASGAATQRRSTDAVDAALAGDVPGAFLESSETWRRVCLLPGLELMLSSARKRHQFRLMPLPLRQI